MTELRKISQEECRAILKEHSERETFSWGYCATRADLSYLDLRDLNLMKEKKYLSNVNLSGSCLDGLDLSDLCLDNADLSYASLKNTILKGVSFNGVVDGYYYNIPYHCADFRDADLTGADLSDITLKEFRSNAIAYGANLTNTKFKEE